MADRQTCVWTLETKPILSPEELRELRGKLGWTQLTMSQVLGVAQRSVQYWEAGEVVPQDIMMAVLYRLNECLRNLEGKKHKKEREAFLAVLQDLLPRILFRSGVAVLLRYLFVSSL